MCRRHSPSDARRGVLRLSFDDISDDTSGVVLQKARSVMNAAGFDLKKKKKKKKAEAESGGELHMVRVSDDERVLEVLEVLAPSSLARVVLSFDPSLVDCVLERMHNIAERQSTSVPTPAMPPSPATKKILPYAIPLHC